jgi:hypothetical protein
MHKQGMRAVLAVWLAVAFVVPQVAFASSHREAPVTALDTKADITDWYTFVSYDHPDRLVMVMNVDPFLEPSNGPNYFPFDPNVLYEMKIDNNHDGIPDVTFQFRFTTQIRAPQVFTGFVGGIFGIPPITSLDGPGAAGLSLRQTYTVTEVRNGVSIVLGTGERPTHAVPSNVGPRTMPNYDSLFNQGIYRLTNSARVFAGTVSDPFYIDLGAAFDSLNFRMATGGGVLPPSIDGDDKHNYAPNAVAGYNVNTIVLEVPITMLTSDGKLHNANEVAAVLGTYATTSRHAMTVRRSPDPSVDSGKYQQIQRLGNPLINELIIGTGSKDRFSMDFPTNDSQFAKYVLDPLLAKIFASIGIAVPPPPRLDLLPLVLYMPPICPACTTQDSGPVADLLRINTGIPPTPVNLQKRLGVLAGDFGGYPDGRRPIDDVVDIAARVVSGYLANPKVYNTRIGDGVNTPDNGLNTSFPYVQPAHSGRQSVHVGPGQRGCSGDPNGICPSN